jgi:hypothetical protein
LPVSPTRSRAIVTTRAHGAPAADQCRHDHGHGDEVRAVRLDLTDHDDGQRRDDAECRRVEGDVESSDGTTRSSKTPTVTQALSAIPVNGTTRLVICAVNFGALPFKHIDRGMRPVEYGPAFTLDNAAVNTTTFMMSPAAGMPMLEKNLTKKLVTCPYAVCGSKRASRISDPT